MKKIFKTGVILVSAVVLTSTALSLEHYEIVIVPSAPEDINFAPNMGKRAAAFSKEQREGFLPNLMKSISKSSDALSDLKGHEQWKSEWTKYHKLFLSLVPFQDDPYKNERFFETLSSVMFETKGFTELKVSHIRTEESQILKSFKSKAVNPIYIYKEDIAWILLHSWRVQSDDLSVVGGLVKAELTWTLVHNDAIYKGYNPEGEGDWWVWGGNIDVFKRGLVCKPDEVIEVLSSKKVLDATDPKLLSELYGYAVKALDTPIGHRQGAFEDGKYIKNSPVVEARVKLAKEKYLPQIKELIEAYLKDKK